MQILSFNLTVILHSLCKFPDDHIAVVDFNIVAVVHRDFTVYSEHPSAGLALVTVCHALNCDNRSAGSLILRCYTQAGLLQNFEYCLAVDLILCLLDLIRTVIVQVPPVTPPLSSLPQPAMQRQNVITMISAVILLIVFFIEIFPLFIIVL